MADRKEDLMMSSIAFDWGQLDSILLPIRGFPAEMHAINFAVFISEATGAKLKVLHVKKTVQQSKFYQVEAILKNLEQKAKNFKIKLEILPFITSDSARKVLRSHLEENHYDLIVMGTQSSQGFPYDLRKSCSVDVANNLPSKTILVVVQGDHDDFDYKERKFSKIMVGYRKSANNDVTIKLASFLASSATDNDIYIARMVKIPNIVPLESVKDILMEVERTFLKSLAGYYKTVQQPLVPKVIVGRSYGKSISYLAKKESIDLLLFSVTEDYSLAGLKNSPIWRIARSGSCPVAYVFQKNGKAE